MHPAAGMNQAPHEVVRHRGDKGGIPDSREELRYLEQARYRFHFADVGPCSPGSTLGVALSVALRWLRRFCRLRYGA